MNSWVKDAFQWLRGNTNTGLEQTILQKKEELHGVQYPPTSKEKIRRCVEDRFSQTQFPTIDPSTIPDTKRKDFYFKVYIKALLGCSEKEIREHVTDSAPPPLHSLFQNGALLERALHKLNNAFMFVYGPECLPCHWHPRERLQCLRDLFVEPDAGLMLPSDLASHYLPSEVEKNRTGTPAFYFVSTNGKKEDWTEIPLKVIQALAKKNCNG